MAKKEYRGRKPISGHVRQNIIAMYQRGNRTAADIAKHYGIGRSTIYKILKDAGTEKDSYRMPGTVR